MNAELRAYFSEREREFDTIADERKKILQPLHNFIRERSASAREIPLVFICTHNSRRSHLAQAAAVGAAAYRGLTGVRSFSGGTEATAVYPSARRAIEQAGFWVEPKNPAVGASANPVLLLRGEAGQAPTALFSKNYAHPDNPQSGFAAIMVCSSADEACPVVPGAELRVALPFDDPKAFDGTSEEEARYAERMRDIAREVLWAFVGPG